MHVMLGIDYGINIATVKGMRFCDSTIVKDIVTCRAHQCM